MKIETLLLLKSWHSDPLFETQLPLGYHCEHHIWMNGNTGMTVMFPTHHLCPGRSAPLTWWCFWPAPTTVWRRGCTNEPSSRDDRTIIPRPSTAAWPTSNKTPFPSSNTSRREASLSRWGWCLFVCMCARFQTRNTLTCHIRRCCNCACYCCLAMVSDQPICFDLWPLTSTFSSTQLLLTLYFYFLDHSL